MKYSQFNSIVSHGNDLFLFNSFSNKCLSVKPELAKIVEARTNKELGRLRQIHPTFYDALCQNGFLVNNDDNEVEKIIKLSNLAINDSKNFVLIVNPTLNCNFKCWYCYEDHIKSSRMSENIIENIKKYIQKIIQENSKLESIHLSFFGGEPLLYFRDVCYPLIMSIKEICASNNISSAVSFTTNGFLVNDTMIEKFKETETIELFQITLDGYREEHDAVRFPSKFNGSYDKIVKNIVSLVNSGFKVIMRINYTPDKLKNCYKILEDLSEIKEESKKNLTTSFHCVWQVGSPSIKDELLPQIRAFRRSNMKVNSNFNLRSVNKICYADLRNSVVVNYNGDIFKCTARNFTSLKREGYLADDGNIIWENNALERRLNVKPTNKLCLSCRLLPACMGGCSQKKLEMSETGTEYCLYKDEKQIDDVIRLHIDRLFHLNKTDKNRITPSDVKILQV